MVEREGFVFFVRLQYEKLPPFCSYCQFIGHSIDNCKKHFSKIDGQNRPPQKEKATVGIRRTMFVPKQKADEKTNIDCEVLDDRRFGEKDNLFLVNQEKADEDAQPQQILDKDLDVDSGRAIENSQDGQTSNSVSRRVLVNPILGLQTDPVDLVEDLDMETKYDESIHPDSPSFVPNLVSRPFTLLDHRAFSQRNSPSDFSFFVPNSSVSRKDRQMVLKNNNVKVANDMKLIGRLWSDEVNEDQEVKVNFDAMNVGNSADNFTKVLSKSQKKKQKKARR